MLPDSNHAGGTATGDEDEDKHKDKDCWRKARLPHFTPSATAEQALAEIVLGCVEHLRGNEACLIARAHEEGVHQMRVAVRRLRSCLALYERFLPVEQWTHLNGELKWLIGELGPARDWDVFVADSLAPVIRQLTDEDRLEALRVQVERHRDEAYARAQAAVTDQRYVGLVLLLGSWAEGRGWRSAIAPDQSCGMHESVSATAHQLLGEIHSSLLKAGEDFEHLDAEGRHKVRIHLKKLRYASEFFSSLYAKRRSAPYIEAMKRLQDDLGTNNDVEVAKKLLKRVVKPTRGKEGAQLAYAAGLVVGWHSHVGGAREEQLLSTWRRFVLRRPYWGRVSPVTAPVGADAKARTDPPHLDPADGGGRAEAEVVVAEHATLPGRAEDAASSTAPPEPRPRPASRRRASAARLVPGT